MFSVDVVWISGSKVDGDGNIEYWKLSSLPLDTTMIRNMDNFKREIERDLFQFISDDWSFDITTEQDNVSFFDPINFITQDYIYRLDITTESGQMYSLFTNKDNRSRVVESPVDYIHVVAFELSSYFKKEGWYLGDLYEKADESYYLFTTGNSALDAEGISNLVVSDINDLIITHEIPLIRMGATITENAIGNVIDGDFNEFIGEDAGEYFVLDYFIDSWNSRMFLLLISNIYDGDDIDADTPIKLAEIANGNDFNIIGEVGYSSPHGNSAKIGFIHRWDTPNTNETVNGANVVITEEVYFNTGGGDGGGGRSEYYQTIFRNYRYNGEGNLEHFGETESTEYESEPLSSWDTWYVNESGDFSTEDSGVNNYAFIGQYSNSTTYSEFTDVFLQYTYYFSDIYNYGSNHYAKSMTYTITQFPLNLRFIFKDVTPFDVMKELCIAQDGFWYLDYSGGVINILYRGRNVVDMTESTAIDLLKVATLEIEKQIISFKDIDSRIFRDNETRMQDYIDYYTAKYGDGKKVKRITLWGNYNFEIGKYVKYLESTYGDGLDYLIKRTEWDIDDNLTNITLFQIGIS